MKKVYKVVEVWESEVEGLDFLAFDVGNSPRKEIFESEELAEKEIERIIESRDSGFPAIMSILPLYMKKEVFDALVLKENYMCSIRPHSEEDREILSKL